MSSVLHSPLDRLLDPFAKCLTVDVARRFVELRADPETQARIDELTAKASEGKLSPQERTEYEGYVEAIDFVAILQAKASEVLARRSTEDDWDNSSEGIAAWLKWYDSLQPLIFTDQERKAWEDDQQAHKEWELAHTDQRDEKLRGLWG